MIILNGALLHEQINHFQSLDITLAIVCFALIIGIQSFIKVKNHKAHYSLVFFHRYWFC
ncbi:hypothetical protein [Alteribacillus sp. YIM 98480]|uniref:hypothetical protein n=1 Tax=Alteribacillus sp. YIM 98480 TaxID=2606599 RepID=UPI00131AB5F3|nr:hypothetical protein [Alteribacillus sp. YIM 98480]